MIKEVGPRTILIRPARPGDAAVLASMFGRCSQQTRYNRFHGPVTEIPAAYLRRCVEGRPPGHRALVAQLVSPGENPVSLRSPAPAPYSSHRSSTRPGCWSRTHGNAAVSAR